MVKMGLSIELVKYNSILSQYAMLFFLSLVSGFSKEFSVFMLAHLFSSLFNNTTQKNHLP